MRKMSQNYSRAEVLLLRRISLKVDNPPKPWRRRVFYGGTTGFTRGAPLRCKSLGDDVKIKRPRPMAGPFIHVLICRQVFFLSLDQSRNHHVMVRADGDGILIG